MPEYPQDKNAAYIDSHAGAGKYILQEEHWKNRFKYRQLVCDDECEWAQFDRLNPLIETEKIYFGSFVLAGKDMECLLQMWFCGIRLSKEVAASRIAL